jgi:hypothetical protein
MKNIETTTQTILSTTATVYDADGKLTESGLTVIQIDEPETSDLDSLIIVGITAHRLSDLERNGDTLHSLAAGWSVVL